MGYEFIQRNMPQAMPCLRTVQTTIHSQYKHIREGQYRFDELLDHLEKHNLPKIVTISEDATRIVKRVEYDHVTNRCVGFALPTNPDGSLDVSRYEATSFVAIEEMFRNSVAAKYAYTIMAQPLEEGAPSYCISCFGLTINSQLETY